MAETSNIGQRISEISPVAALYGHEKVPLGIPGGSTAVVATVNQLKDFIGCGITIDTTNNILSFGGKQFVLTPYSGGGGSGEGGGETPTKYTLTLSVSPSNGGSVSGGGTYDKGQSVTIIATPSSGYEFVKWSDGNTNASRTVTITANLSLTATFRSTAPATTYTYYVGEIDCKSSEFASKATSELQAASTKKTTTSTSTGDIKQNVTHKVFFVMIPTSATLSKFLYTSDGSVSNILGDSAFNATHANVTIDGVAYKVLAYRSGVVSASDPLEYTFNIRF